MISYELAKSLKDAGFPQPDGHARGILSFKGSFVDEAYIPTLSELIEACGDRFHCLVHEMNGGIDSDREFWSAGTTRDVTDWQNGSTPEEAVAQLYLKLHAKE